MQLKLPIRPGKFVHDLVEQGKFVDKDIGQLHVIVHTDLRYKFVTVEVELYDRHHWRVEGPVAITLPLSEVTDG